MEHFYYLHTNGELIHKNLEPESDSPFVKKIWRINVSDRSDAWRVVLESMALGANLDRIAELMSKWQLNRADLKELLLRVLDPTDLMKKGLPMFAVQFLGFVDEEDLFGWIERKCPLS